MMLGVGLFLTATPLAAALSTLSRQGVLQGRVSATQAPRSRTATGKNRNISCTTGSLD